MELRASSSRVAVTVMPSDGSMSGLCGGVWPSAEPAEKSAGPATKADTPTRHRIASPCVAVRFPKVADMIRYMIGQVKFGPVGHRPCIAGSIEPAPLCLQLLGAAGRPVVPMLQVCKANLRAAGWFC